MTTWTKFVAPTAALLLGMSGTAWWAAIDGGADVGSSEVEAPLHRQTPDDDATDATDAPTSDPVTTDPAATVATTVAPTSVPPTVVPTTVVPMTLPTTVAPPIVTVAPTTTPPTTIISSSPAVAVPAGFDVSTWQRCSSASWDVALPSDWYAYAAKQYTR